MPLAQEAAPAPKAETPRKRRSHKFKKAMSSMFAPTATFLARITGKAAGQPDASRSQNLRQSMVAKILNSPQVGASPGQGTHTSVGHCTRVGRQQVWICSVGPQRGVGHVTPSHTLSTPCPHLRRASV